VTNTRFFPGIGAGPAHPAPHADPRNLEPPLFVSYPTAACRFVVERFFPIDARELSGWRLRTERRAGRVVVSTAALALEAEMKIAAGRRLRAPRLT
jgi:hypothetical protein